MPQTDSSPADEHRANYLDVCREIEDHLNATRNHAMKPGNVWLAKAELAKIVQLSDELEQLLEAIKIADQS